MASYFEEMGWTPLEDGQQPDHNAHFARLMRDFHMFDELVQAGQKFPPPAAKSAVESLPKETIDKKGQQCTICLKEFDIGSTCTKMPCQHKFHTECIMPWLLKTNSCPLCREELPTDDEDYECMKKERKRAKERVEDIDNLHNSMFT